MSRKKDDTEDPRRLEALRRRVEELTTDIGSVLHANTSILFMTQQTLDVALRALGPSPFGSDVCPTAEEVDEVMAGPVKQAERALAKLLALYAEPERGELLPVHHREALEGYRTMLADVPGHVPIAESRASTLRTIACRIEDLLESLPSGHLPREAVRNLTRAVKEIERHAALASVLQTRSAILQMDYTIRSLREFVTTNMRRTEPARPLSVAVLLEEAHRQLIEYARTSNVAVRFRLDARGSEIVGVKRDLVRAFGNLLHNAIKYSWRRDSSHQPWVGVQTAREGGDVLIAFENWGVPIDPREIAEGLLFELGYRGKWSIDRGRLGTGIGLTDAHDVIERHHGTITVASRPARSWGPDDPENPEYHRQPFLTTITVRLPEAV